MLKLLGDLVTSDAQRLPVDGATFRTCDVLLCTESCSTVISHQFAIPRISWLAPPRFLLMSREGV
jgi:hypothetical protein